LSDSETKSADEQDSSESDSDTSGIDEDHAAVGSSASSDASTSTSTSTTQDTAESATSAPRSKVTIPPALESRMSVFASRKKPLHNTVSYKESSSQVCCQCRSTHSCRSLWI
jgi:hypothetical protein